MKPARAGYAPCRWGSTAIATLLAAFATSLYAAPGDLDVGVGRIFKRRLVLASMYRM